MRKQGRGDTEPCGGKFIACAYEIIRRAIVAFQSQDVPAAVVLQGVESHSSSSGKAEDGLLLVAEIQDGTVMACGQTLDDGELQCCHVLDLIDLCP